VESVRRLVSERFEAFAEQQRLQIAHREALPQLALLGIVSGLLSGAVIIAFRWIIEAGQELILPSGTADIFETLSIPMRVALPLAGGVCIGWVLHLLPAASRQVGIPHVIERLAYHQGHLPLRNALLQFFGAALSLICGHSVGREGPSVHLGAASASQLGQRLGLPNHSMRTLAGCGVAAAIAAGFNTPLAGVIFAMEVVLVEYTIVGFAPIILAAVSATTLTRLIYGADPAFLVPPMQWTSVAELPYVLLMGIGIGALAAAFIHALQFSSRLLASQPVWLRATLAGLAVGVIAIPVPSVMGISYDTVNAALLGELTLVTLAVFVFAKLAATSLALGLGLPGGLIAPTLVMGAGAGGAVALVVVAVTGTPISHGFYAMLGMGAMMAATLQAPLAALIAIFELTANPNIIMPGMIAVIAAMLVCRVVFRLPSIYALIMRQVHDQAAGGTVVQTLSRISVASVMDRNIDRKSRHIARSAAEALLKREPGWIIVRDDTGVSALLPAADLARFLAKNPQAGDIDLLEIPAQRLDLVHTNILATLQEALDLLNKTGKQALYVTGARGAAQNKIYGVVTREIIERSYRPE